MTQPRKRTVTPPELLDASWIVARWDEGLSNVAIAEAVGCTPQTVAAAAQRHRLSRRTYQRGENTRGAVSTAKAHLHESLDRLIKRRSEAAADLAEAIDGIDQVTKAMRVLGEKAGEDRDVAERWSHVRTSIMLADGR